MAQFASFVGVDSRVGIGNPLDVTDTCDQPLPESTASTPRKAGNAIQTISACIAMIGGNRVGNPIEATLPAIAPS